jgi:hypothetical protein
VKKFILFAFDKYYPCGGLSDISGSFETLDEAVAFEGADPCRADFAYVVDRDTWEGFGRSESERAQI